MRTKRELSITYQHGAMPWTVVVPKGTRVRLAAYSPTVAPYYWVDDLSFLAVGSIERHDCECYGINVLPEDVEDA